MRVPRVSPSLPNPRRSGVGAGIPISGSVLGEPLFRQARAGIPAATTEQAVRYSIEHQKRELSEAQNFSEQISIKVS